MNVAFFRAALGTRPKHSASKKTPEPYIAGIWNQSFLEITARNFALICGRMRRNSLLWRRKFPVFKLGNSVAKVSDFERF
ncbi:hypothetical protein [Sphingopyxis sp. NFH-91]|jgi:hypothetical protein|uniref:hypothetical protein n=1 Tax=Sphingopyxis sp. NFH-91 TaxID=2744457 RepID=UPI001F25D797|nr:hypothetical protein [Sphingopyxis sp. NFH-91]